MRRAFSQKLAGAVMDAMFLVGPMWLFTLHRHLLLLQGGTAVSVSGFGFLTIFLGNSPADIFTATLSYTNVPVVFVGVTIRDSKKRRPG